MQPSFDHGTRMQNIEVEIQKKNLVQPNRHARADSNFMRMIKMNYFGNFVLTFLFSFA